MTVLSSGRVIGTTLARMRAQDQREADKAARIELRAVRAAERAQGKARGVRAPTRCTVVWTPEMEASFFTLIDTSAGPDSCHEWTGSRQFNHRDPTVERFEQGVFHVGRNKPYAHRLVCMHEFKVESLSSDIDISPLCDNHLCCNTRHLVARPHGGRDAAMHIEAVPVAEFFRPAEEPPMPMCRCVSQEELEKAADEILAAA